MDRLCKIVKEINYGNINLGMFACLEWKQMFKIKLCCFWDRNSFVCSYFPYKSAGLAVASNWWRLFWRNKNKCFVPNWSTKGKLIVHLIDSSMNQLIVYINWFDLVGPDSPWIYKWTDSNVTTNPSFNIF